MKVLKGSPIPYSIPEDIEDDMTIIAQDYSWLHAGQYTQESNPLIQRYLEDGKERLAYVGPDGRFHFHGGRSREIMQDMSFINQGLCLLHDQANSQAIRGTSLADLRIANGFRRRNHFRHHGQTRHIIQYTKTTNNRQMDLFLPILMAPEIQRLDEMYLILLRPMEEVLAHAIWGSKSRTLYREFMFVQMGQRVTETMLYKQFPVMYKRYFGVDFLLTEYRLWAIAVMREYIPPEYHLQNDGDTVGDRMGQHSTNIARGIYSGVEGDLPYLTTDAMWHYDQFCHCWQDICGFGRNPPPAPLKILRRSIHMKNSAVVTSAVSSNEASATVNPGSDGAIANILQTLANKLTAMEEQMKMQEAKMGVLLHTLRQEMKEDTQQTLAQGLATLYQSHLGVSKSLTKTTSKLDHSVASPLVVNRNAEPVDKEDSSDSSMAIDYPSDIEDLYTKEVEDAVSAVEERAERGTQEDSIEEKALGTIRKALNNPDASWRSHEQRDTILEALAMSHNVVSVMKTGGGKSMTWIVPVLMQATITVVVVPFNHLLEQHLVNAKRMGCRAMRWTTKSGLIGDNNLIFVALETAAATGFKRWGSMVEFILAVD